MSRDKQTMRAEGGGAPLQLKRTRSRLGLGLWPLRGARPAPPYAAGGHAGSVAPAFSTGACQSREGKQARRLGWPLRLYLALLRIDFEPLINTGVLLKLGFCTQAGIYDPIPLHDYFICHIHDLFKA